MDFLVTLKQNPPDRISLIHAIILSDDRLVMAKSAEVNLRQSSIPFEEFKNNFLHQDVKMPNHIDHIHILSYDAKNSQMEFVSLHNQHLYLLAKTNGLDLIRDIVNQIIAKEILITNQINNFLSDIIRNNVSFTTTKKPVAITDNPIVSNVDKRSVNHLSSDLPEKSSKKPA